MIKRKKALMMSLIAGMCLITACAKNTEETVQDQSEMPSVTETASNQSEMPSETETASNQSEMSGETETASNQSEMSSTTETVSSDVMEDEAIQENKTKEKRPQIVFLENVKNLVGHDNGNTFDVIIHALHKEGYSVKYSILNAMEYGNVPQNRERIYIVGFKDKNLYKNFEFPSAIPLTTKLTDIIDFDTKIDEKYYYTKGKYKGDIYEKLVEAMDEEDAVYQWHRKYVRKNKSGVVPTLTANQGEGGHNVCLIKTINGIRKMTPHECIMLFKKARLNL